MSRSEFDANRGLAARRVISSEGVLRPRPMLQRMAEHERNARANRLAGIVAYGAIIIGTLVGAGFVLADVLQDRTGEPIVIGCICGSDSDCARTCGGYGDPEPAR